jgi:glycosyltransferase involved in cell wall biosynthesis
MNKRLKVLHIVPMLSPGGAERVMVHIARELDRQRYEPAVISLTGRLECDLDRMLDEGGVESRYLGKHPGFDFRMYARLHRALKDCQPDIVHTHLHVLRYALPSLLVSNRVRVVHTVHNLAKREIEPRLRWLQRYALHHRVVPVAVADEVAVSLQRVYGIPACRVIPNGIPTRSYASPKTPRREWRAKEGLSETDLLFVCVARFAPQKNHLLLLKAFAQGPASEPNAHLILVGDGVLREQLKREAENLRITRQVHFLGLRADIPDVLGAMDVFVLSSDWEGNPLSVMEAMAAGLPVVSTDAGGVPDLVENGKHGVVVRVGDLHGFAESLILLSRDKELRESLGKAAGQRARERFDVSAMVRSYEQVYEALIAQSHGASAKSVIRESMVHAQQGLGQPH